METRFDDTARYEQLVRHANALVGTVGVAIDLYDAETHQLHRVASSCTGSLDVQPSDAPVVSVEKLLYTPQPSQFTAAVLDSDKVVEWTIEEALCDGSGEAARLRAQGITHVLGCRIESRAGLVWGLILWLLDHPTTPDERTVIAGFSFAAARYADTKSSTASGRYRSWHRLHSLLDISDAALLGSGPDLSSLLQTVVDRLRIALRADIAVILLREDGEPELKASAVSLSEAGRMSGPLERFQTPWTVTGLTGEVTGRGQILLVSDTRETPQAARRLPPDLPEALLAAPLVVRGRTIGVLRASAFQPGHFGESDIRLIDLLARQTAIAVENARLYETTREQAERLALYARIFAASPEAITLVGRDGCFLECNPAAERLYGYSAEEIIGQSAQMLYSAENPAELIDELRTALRTVGEWHGEVQQRRKDGSLFSAEMHRTTVRDDDGRAIGSVGVVHDLTRRKELEAHFVQTEKLRSLGVLASGVAHQMNNTLASILGQAELLLGTVFDEAVQQQLRAIIQAAEDGAAAVRRIQNFARVVPPTNHAAIDLAEMARDVAVATAPRWRDQAEREGRAIKLSVVADGPVYTSGLAAELREALTNLVLNAVDALPQGGNITVSVTRQGDQAVLRVTDDGVGMSEEVQRRALDPFFTTKAFGAGSGLGLALTHGIMQRHGGTITLQSQIGQGTGIELRLPTIAARVSEPEPAGAGAPAALRVLVVDDEPLLATQLRVILSMDGHQVRICDRGADAISTLAEEPFDLVITDLGMPEVNGWEVARAAKARLPGVRVGLITGWAGELTDEAELERAGVDFVISKPYRIQTVRDAVSQATAG